jgi:hypothetical protein
LYLLDIFELVLKFKFKQKPIEMPIDYSKWKNIEISDDEDDTHPNIDTPSLFRWRHQARLERQAEAEREKSEFQKAKQQ